MKMRAILSLLAITVCGPFLNPLHAADPDGLHRWSNDKKPNPFRLTVWIPPNLPVVRGLVVIGDGGEVAARMPQLRAFAANLGFGIASASHLTTGGAPEILQGLSALARSLNRPELAHAPMVAAGNSNGGAMVMDLLFQVPDRMIAVCPTVGARAGLAWTEKHRAVPMILAMGIWDNPGGNLRARETFQSQRALGALWAHYEEEITGHEGADRRRMYDVFLPFWETVIRLRYPEEGDVRRRPLALKPLTENSGWLCQLSPDLKTGTVEAWNDFDGDRRAASWLPDRASALAFRAAAVHGKPFIINAGHPGSKEPADWEYLSYRSADKVFNPGEPVELTLQTWAADRNRIEIYRGDQLAATGGFTRFGGFNQLRHTVFPDPGAHGFWAVGTRGHNFVWHFAAPMRVFVRGGPGEPLRPRREGPPEFTVPPANVTAPEGGVAELAAYARAGANVRYFWERDGQPLPGIHCNILRLDNLTAAHAGTYRLRVRDDLGETLSPPATLKVTPFQGPRAAFYPATLGEDGAAPDSLWEKAAFTPISLPLINPVQNGHRADFAAAWSPTHLHLRVRVTDPQAETHSEDFWKNDMVEIFVEGTNRKAPVHTGDSVQINITRNGEARELLHNRLPAAGLYRTIPTDTGYLADAVIPWAALGVTPKANGFAGLEIYVNFQSGGRAALVNRRNVAWIAPDALTTLRLDQP